MNIIVALQALRDGKRIRRTDRHYLDPCREIYELVKSNDCSRECIVNQNFRPTEIKISGFDNNIWEIVE